MYLCRVIARMVRHHRPASWASVTESYTLLPPVKRIGVAMKFPTGHYDNDQINVLQAAHIPSLRRALHKQNRPSEPRTRRLDIDGVCEIRPH